MSIQNSMGKIWYGMHFYPGVAEYADEGKDPYRVLLNEDTIRTMDPTFAGRPVFVMHVDGVSDDLDTLRGEADGWVIQSFYNQADGKHWVKFIVVSERGEAAIRAGMRLSNCYAPKSFSGGGLWNGVQYAKEITSGEYEHLAIVPNPRYDESVIMSPEQFKAYNAEKEVELTRLANATKEGTLMKLSIFRREKVQNSPDLENMVVVLPNTKRELDLATMVKELDDFLEAKGKAKVANAADFVEVPVRDDKGVVVKNADGSDKTEKMTVADLVTKHQAMCDEMENMRKRNISFEVDSDTAGEVDHELENADDDGDGDMDEDDKKKKNKKKNDDGEDAAAKAAAKAAADRLRNAREEALANGDDGEEVAVVQFGATMVAKGKARYGS